MEEIVRQEFILGKYDKVTGGIAFIGIAESEGRQDRFFISEVKNAEIHSEVAAAVKVFDSEGDVDLYQIVLRKVHRIVFDQDTERKMTEMVKTLTNREVQALIEVLLHDPRR